VFSTTILVYAILGYWYVLRSFSLLVEHEFKQSKFVDILEKLIRIREDEENDFTVRTIVVSPLPPLPPLPSPLTTHVSPYYQQFHCYQNRFPMSARYTMAASFELEAQRKHFAGALRWLPLTFIRTIKGLIRVRHMLFYHLPYFAQCPDYISIVTHASL
jgi:hypothetical protein